MVLWCEKAERRLLDQPNPWRSLRARLRRGHVAWRRGDEETRSRARKRESHERERERESLSSLLYWS